MRIILITGDATAHRYVANQLASAIKLEAIIVDHGRKLTRNGRLRQVWKRYTAAQIFSRLLFSLFRRIWKDDLASERSMTAVLGKVNCGDFKCPELLRHVDGINTKPGVELVRSLDPDVILVYGTGIVGTKVLMQARRLALNMHTGISPYYRGCDCAFWPLYNEEPQMVGATVHECTKDVDGGRIFGTTQAVLHEDDDLFAVFARSVAAGAQLYVEKVSELLEHDLIGSTQDFSVGKEYKAYMKGVFAELKVRRSIKEGLIRQYVLKG
jgi:methionyl-tRNA formyltransferase